MNTVNDQQSLWLRQMASGQSTEIVPAEIGVKIQRAKFSGDGEYIYFSRKFGTDVPHLDRVPIFGGVVDTNIVSGPDTHFDISSDASLVAFPRNEDRKSSLVVAPTGGSESKTIFETEKTITGNALSPDGRTVALPAASLFQAPSCSVFLPSRPMAELDAGNGQALELYSRCCLAS